MGLVHTGIKNYPMCTMKYTAVSLMLWVYISAGGPGHLVQIDGIMDSIKYQIKKILKLTVHDRNRIMGHGQIFQQDNDPQMNIIEQNQTKTGSLRKKQTKLQLWPSQSSDLNPIDNE